MKAISGLALVAVLFAIGGSALAHGPSKHSEGAKKQPISK